MITTPLCPQLQTATDFCLAIKTRSHHRRRRGIEALTYSSCFKAPLASPWEELLSEEETQGQGVTQAADAPFRRAHSSQTSGEWRSAERGSGKEKLRLPAAFDQWQPI